MKRARIAARILIIAAVVVGAGGITIAAAKPQSLKATRDRPQECQQVVLAAGQDGDITVSLGEDSIIRILTDDGRCEVLQIDLEQIGSMVEAALDEAGAALAGLSDLQIDLQLGQDSRLSIQEDDEQIEIDLAAIGQIVHQALEDVLAKLKTTRHLQLPDGKHGSALNWSEGADQQQLQQQLEKMHQEIAALKQELRRLRQRQRH
jgi:hypothetical protein